MEDYSGSFIVFAILSLISFIYLAFIGDNNTINDIPYLNIPILGLLFIWIFLAIIFVVSVFHIIISLRKSR